MLSFIQYIKKQYKRYDRVGDLARDVRADRKLSKNIKTAEEFKNYVVKRNGHIITKVSDTIDAAFLEYKNYYKKAG